MHLKNVWKKWKCAEGKKGKRGYFRHSGDFIHAQNRFWMEKALPLEGRSIKTVALGWESCRTSKVSDLKSSSSSRKCLARVGERGSSHQQSPAWHQDRNNGHGNRTEEIDKPKKFKNEQAFREIEKKPLKKFSHIPPVASPHGEAGWNTTIANQGEEP